MRAASVGLMLRDASQRETVPMEAALKADAATLLCMRPRKRPPRA
jgi:hypothetical protein